MRLPALRRWHILAVLMLVGLACWWALIKGLLWVAGTLTGSAVVAFLSIAWPGLLVLAAMSLFVAHAIRDNRNRGHR